jgi:hypothetical protein
MAQAQILLVQKKHTKMQTCDLSFFSRNTTTQIKAYERLELQRSNTGNVIIVPLFMENKFLSNISSVFCQINILTDFKGDNILSTMVHLLLHGFIDTSKKKLLPLV